VKIIGATSHCVTADLDAGLMHQILVYDNGTVVVD
jgi:formyltetrahydrofolate hydrolase